MTDRLPEDQQWLREAVHQYERPLTLYALKFVGELERARDVVQDTFMKLIDQDRDQVSPHLAEWLYTVTRNRAIDVIRKESRMRQISDVRERLTPSERPGPAATAAERDTQSRVLELIDELPEEQAEMLRLRFQHGMKYHQISKITGRSISTVGYLIHEAMKTIRARLGVEEPT